MSNLEDLEDKFIVINKKRFKELNEAYHSKKHSIFGHPVLHQLGAALDALQISYKRMTGNPMDQKYIVCNQDEPYAEEVARIILEGEARKNGTEPAKVSEDVERDIESVELSIYCIGGALFEKDKLQAIERFRRLVSRLKEGNRG